jgi:hypothetical protein
MLWSSVLPSPGRGAAAASEVAALAALEVVALAVCDRSALEAPLWPSVACPVRPVFGCGARVWTVDERSVSVREGRVEAAGVLCGGIDLPAWTPTARRTHASRRPWADGDSDDDDAARTVRVSCVYAALSCTLRGAL